MNPNDEYSNIQLWLERRKQEVEESVRLSPISWGGSYERPFYYRPDEVLLTQEAWQRLGADQNGFGLQPYEPDVLPEENDWRAHRGAPGDSDINWRLAETGSDLRLYTVPTGVRRDDPNGLPTFVSELRGRLQPEPPAAFPDPAAGVHLNHVMFAEQIYHGGPGDDPEPLDEPPTLPPEPEPGKRPRRAELEDRADLAILDTGVPLNYLQIHPYLRNFVYIDNDDIDYLDEHNVDSLNTCGGHGLFICGLVYRMAPTLRVDMGRVLRATGDGDDAGIAVEVAETKAPVINLSLGGPTMDGEPIPALASAIRKAVASDDKKVVVAAAGNAGRYQNGQKWWPAAMPEVVGVGASDQRASGSTIAGFSNRGDWVTVFAPGVRVSSTYLGYPWKSQRDKPFGGWATWSGTSFAAPQFAAEVALRLTRSPGKTAQQVKDELLDELHRPLPGPEGAVKSAGFYRPNVNLWR